MSQATLNEVPEPLIPWKTWQDAAAYLTDAWQRSVLYADVMRRRGNQYHEHLQEDVPHVLNFPYEPVLSGQTLARPVNYWLVRILPPDGTTIDPRRRPFIVVDPRAGHGPGIGGFKADSEVGAALRAGHPCYFIGFLPDPVPGQTVEDVMHAEAQFVEKVIELHPENSCKPVVVANCQAGWQILMTAAMRPELFGPILVAGAPVSYWAGNNPMRYLGGLLGGSWLTALTSDLGAGRFDGAWLVKNFENLNPANTLWGKQYGLYARVDTEADRYLDFEKYWGGYVYLNDVEIQYIVDNLFIGNRLATAELITSDGVRIDLRNIRSPIIVFCSKGDNITPPGQALGWITDLYREQRDVLAHNQTIVYSVHESIGHLGIFVSGSVGSKEHREFTDNIDLVEVLPPGIYEAVLDDKDESTHNPELADGDYVMKFRERHVSDVREIVKPDLESEKRFAAVAKVSQINLGWYRSFVQPWIKSLVTPAMAEWNQQMHPLRLAYEWQSDRNPWSRLLASQVEKVQEARAPVAKDNPFWRWQQAVSKITMNQLNLWRDVRDESYALMFRTIYGSPWVQSLAGLQGSTDVAPRRHPGNSPENRSYVEREVKRLREHLHKGDLVDATLRALFYLSRARREVDERAFNLIRGLRDDIAPCRTGCFAEFKDRVRLQIELMLLDADEALAAIPELLAKADAPAIREVERFLQDAIARSGDHSDDEQQRLQRMLKLFERVAMELDPPPKAEATKPAVAASPASQAKVTADDKPATQSPDVKPKAQPEAATASDVPAGQSQASGKGDIPAVQSETPGSLPTPAAESEALDSAATVRIQPEASGVSATPAMKSKATEADDTPPTPRAPRKKTGSPVKSATTSVKAKKSTSSALKVRGTTRATSLPAAAPERHPQAEMFGAKPTASKGVAAKKASNTRKRGTAK